MRVTQEEPIDVGKFRAGDPHAFERVVRTHYERVFRLCLRMTGSPADAEDLTQDTFLRIHRKAAHFRGDSDLSTWIYRIAYNQCLDHLRRRRRRPADSLDGYEESGRSLPDPASGPEEHAFARVEAQRVRAALASLPEEYRAVVILREIEDLSYEQIAAVLRCPVGTVRSRLARGRRLLIERLEGSVQDDVSDGLGSAAAAR